jgi:hypothetical protein
VITFYKKHINKIAPVFLKFGGIVFDGHSLGNRLSAGGLGFAVDKDGANAAASMRGKVRMVAKSGYVNTGIISGLQDCLVGFAFYFDAVNCKGYLVAHFLSFIL